MPRSSIKISVIIGFGIPRSASSSHTVSCWSLLIAARTRSTFSGVLLVGSLAECGSLLTDSELSLKCLCRTFICTTLIALSLKAFWIIWTVSMEKCSSLTQNLMQICCSTLSIILNGMTTHSMHAHSAAFTTLTDQYSEVIIVHTCTFQNGLECACYWLPVTWMSWKPFLLYEQWLDFFWTD